MKEHAKVDRHGALVSVEFHGLDDLAIRKGTQPVVIDIEDEGEAADVLQKFAMTVCYMYEFVHAQEAGGYPYTEFRLGPPLKIDRHQRTQGSALAGPPFQKVIEVAYNSLGMLKCACFIGGVTDPWKYHWMRKNAKEQILK
jgi:hypothetical protein